MKACASLSAIKSAGADVALTATAFVDGVPEPRLVIESFAARGALDLREVSFRVASDVDDAIVTRWLRSQVIAALAQRLPDEQVRWLVLASGRLRSTATNIAAAKDHQQFELVDAWQDELREPVPIIWWRTTASELRRQTSGTLGIGRNANRSQNTYAIADSHVHVLSDNGQDWTVKTALALVSASGRLKLGLDGIPREIADAPLIDAVDLARPLNVVLERILQPYGLIIQRDLSREGMNLIERRQVRPLQRGRRVHVGWARSDRPLSEVLRIDVDRPADAAEPWIVQGAGWLVESTFDLVGGWDASLEGAADAQYGQASSSDFATYANVYRQWVLNEDGHFTDSPYNRGPAFNLTTFFQQGDIRAQALRFLPCLTLDDAGRRRAVIVETSTDGGSTWARYVGKAVLLTDRAGVYFDDATLDTGFLAAAKAGTSRVRITGCLNSPQGVRMMRWRGNPFAGQRPPRVFELGEAFRFQRVDFASVHHPAVTAGTLSAQQIDQSNDMLQWLVRRMQREQASAAELTGRGRLELAGARPWLRIGDALVDAGGAGRTAGGERQSVNDQGAVIAGLRCRFGVSQTVPNTTIDLLF
jgi:hypothetical protein